MCQGRKGHFDGIIDVYVTPQTNCSSASKPYLSFQLMIEQCTVCNTNIGDLKRNLYDTDWFHKFSHISMKLHDM